MVLNVYSITSVLIQYLKIMDETQHYLRRYYEANFLALLQKKKKNVFFTHFCKQTIIALLFFYSCDFRLF